VRPVLGEPGEKLAAVGTLAFVLDVGEFLQESDHPRPLPLGAEGAEAAVVHP